jgi:hypothetical protein
MFSQLITVVGIILIAIFALDYVFLRRFAKRRSLLVDLAPVLGFIGAVLIALAFVEAARRGVVGAWQWGIASGLLLLLGLGLADWVRSNMQVRKGESGFRIAMRIVQTFGFVLLIGLLGVLIAVRVIGALVEVFIASALGVFALGAVIGYFVREWRRKSVSNNL